MTNFSVGILFFDSVYKMNAMKSIIILVSLLFFSISCSNSDKGLTSNEELVESKMEDEPFSEFYGNFFNDRKFQMSRINFPLRGTSTEYVFDERIHPDTENEKFMVVDGKFYWQEQGWVQLNELDDTNQEFSVEFIEKGKKIDQIIKSKVDDFVIVMEFELLGDQWYLVYYSSDWY